MTQVRNQRQCVVRVGDFQQQVVSRVFGSIAVGNLLTLREQRDIDCDTGIPSETIGSRTMSSHSP